MEIDLEMPSCEQEKLEIESNRNDVANTTCGVHAEDQNINSPTRTDNGKEVLNENIFSCQDQVDLNTTRLDNTGQNSFKEPQNGMVFESKEAAYSFYREYARLVGFGITIKASRRSKKSGKFIDIKIACSRFGSKRESSATVNPRPCMKTGCKAGMHMKKTADEKWVIYSFTQEHNHEICPDDFFRGRNKQTTNVANQKKGMQLALDGVDVKVMTEYFMSMQDENPNFFYAMDLDHDRRLRSVLWVDSKGRLDYRSFNDVVFIDTFYLKNKYKIPFIPIVGVNHHFQYILLGCALIGEESVSSFIWLMQSWLKAMDGLAPKVIITDQENFLKEAVLQVFPDKHHCFGLWHILRKLDESLGHITSQSNNFMEKFYKCIYNSWLDEQFEKRWWKLISRFELKDNQWVQSLYEDRKKWVPTYMCNVFLGGMSTTVRSDSIISYFDKYIHVDSTLKELIKQYEVFCTDRLDMETKADFETQKKQPTLKSLSPFEKQVASVYTDTIFRKFQSEILGVVSCHLQKERENRETAIFQVDDFEERKKFMVTWNEAELDVRCSCHSFEYNGFLCRHAILVIQMYGITKIPSHYILKRWTKDAKANQLTGDRMQRLPNRMQRFNDLCRRAVKLSEIGSLSQDTYHIAFQALEEVYKHCVKVNNSVRSTSESKSSAHNGFVDVEENYGKNKKKSTKKKKSQNKRGRFGPESINMRVQDRFGQGEQMNPRAHNFSNCYIPQQETQTADLESRAPTVESYSESQQNMHGDVPTNSICTFSFGEW